MNEAGTEKLRTLTDEMARLDEAAWKIDALLFGERPVAEAKQTALAGDKITAARNKISNIAERLEQIARQMQVI